MSNQPVTWKRHFACWLVVLHSFTLAQLSQALTVSGKVSDGGSGASGVKVVVSATWIVTETATLTTGSSGNYSVSGIPTGASVKITVSQSGYQFSSTSTSFTMGFSSVTRNFTRYSTISGTVKRADGANVGSVSISRGGSSTSTEANGSYSFTKLSSGGYTITPSKAGLVFSPASRFVSIGPSKSGQNFTVANPLATTLAASGIGFGDATLNGSMIGGIDTDSFAWFEYGVGGAFDFSTEVQTFSVGSSTVSVSASVTNLTGGSDVNYRLVTSNSYGTSVGNTMMLRMPFLAAGTAVQFDGVNDYVLVGTDPRLKMSTNLTIEAWIHPTGSGNGTDGSGMIVNREGEYEIARYGDGTIRYAIDNTSPNWVFVNTGVVAPLNEWLHMAFTYDANASTNQIRLYTNGVLAYTGQGSGPITDAVTSQNEFRIGNRQSGSSTHFKGHIDDVRVWDIARSHSDIQGNFQRRLTGTEPGLVLYFRFDEGFGTSTADLSSSGLVGNLANGAAWAVSGAVIRDPVVETLPASPVLATTATLRGTVNASGDPTQVFFEYGSSLAFGQTTAVQPAGSGLGTVEVSTTVTNLDPGTSYFYRLVANNSFGTTVGGNETFTTLVLGCGWPISTKITSGDASSPRHIVDAEGNAYIAGLFSGDGTFKNTLTPTGGGGTNAFIGKLARGADWMWATNVALSTDGSLRLHALTLDNSTNLYVAGQFSGTAYFGTNELVATGGSDIFVAKINGTDGTWTWARSSGDASADAAYAIAKGPSGSIYISGQFTGSSTFGPSSIVSSNNTPDAFVAKIDPNGDWLWASSAPGNGNADRALSIVVDANENIYTAGEFGLGIRFGQAALNSIGAQDLFVARIDPNGEWLLARRGGGISGNDVATALAVDSANQIYLLGRFTGAADYSGSVSNLNLGAVANLFVAKLNTSLNMLWYAQGGAGNADSIAVDRNGHAYISGDFDFGTSFGATALTTAGNGDVFIAQLSTDAGTWNWAKKIGSSGNESRGSIAVDASGGVVVSGSYQNTIQIGHVLLTSPNDQDIFIARIGPDQVYEHNNYVIGQAIPVPVEAMDPSRTDGAALGQPSITILEKEHADSDALNSFFWSLSEKKLYPLRPVTAVLKWPLTADVTNTTLVATCVGRTLFPVDPQYHVASTPVDLEPDLDGFPYKFGSLAFTTILDASVDASTKQFSATQTGWSVIQFYDTGGALPNPTIHPSKFEVVRTLPWNDPSLLVDNQPAEIGTPLQNLMHTDLTGKNGYVFFENAFYDGAGEDRSYDRATRTGPIIPVNKDTVSLKDDLVVVWYRANQVTGIPWPSLPVRYVAQWPVSPSTLVLASGEGSGVLSVEDFPSKRVYQQQNRQLPGFNPNEEHAAIYGDVLFALRNDLNSAVNASEPYTLLKYQDPATVTWTMKVFKVVSTNASQAFDYIGEAGSPLFLPSPLNFLTLCGFSNSIVSGPGYQDHLGRLYARAAGPTNGPADIVARYFYPLQENFFYDLNNDGEPDVPVGTCIPWLDRSPGGVVGIPRNIHYIINWPADIPTLQIGETLLGAKFGLPDLLNFASASVVYDEGNAGDTNALNSLVRLFDPLSERTLQLADDFVLPAEIATVNSAGRLVMTDLPYAIRSRLHYDNLNKRLSFGGLLDENVEYGGPENPLLLINVLSPRERDRIIALSSEPQFMEAITNLYDLTRNPNRIDQNLDNLPDQELLIGLTAPNLNTNSNVRTGPLEPEELGSLPKALSAGAGTGTGYITVVENDDPALSGLPITLHIIRVDDGPFRGDIKVIKPDNVFDEKLTLRHSADFGGEPQRLEFEWYYHPDEASFDSTDLPVVASGGSISDLRGWTKFPAVPIGVNGFNDITIGDGGLASILTLSDNWFICRYRGYDIDEQTNVWSEWVGVIGGGQAQLAEGWVKRVLDGLNPFEARTDAFHENESVTFASMLQQAGTRYEGDIAFNPSGDNINNVGLIEAYQTVLNRAKDLSVEAVPGINFEPANNALLLAAGRIADLYMLLGNEAFADAADPTIGFRTDSAGYGTLAPSIFTFQNQLDSLLEEELSLLRGRDDKSATVRSAPIYNRLFWNFTRDEGEVAYAQAYNITDQNNDGFIDANDASIMYPQGHGDAWGHYLTATKAYYSLLRNPFFEWIPRSESILLAGVPVQVDYLDERKFARAAAAKAKTGAEIVDLTYRSSYVDNPEGQYQGYKDTDASRAWGLSEWGHRAGSGAFFDWVLANAILPATDPDPSHTGLEKIDRATVLEIGEISAAYETVQNQTDKADAGLSPLGLARNVVPFDIDPSQIDAGKTHFEQIYERALEAMKNTVTVFDHANQLSQALRELQDSVNDFSQNVAEQERDYKNRLIEVFGYPYAGDIGAGSTYPSGYDGPDLYHYMYVNSIELNGETAPANQSFSAFFESLGDTIPNFDYVFGDDFSGVPNLNLVTSDILQVNYPFTTGDFGFVPPSTWGQRRAPGELQIALSELLQSEARFKQALLNYNNLLEKIDDQIELLESRYGLREDVLRMRNRANGQILPIRIAVAAAKASARTMTALKDRSNDMYQVMVETLPKSVGLATDAFAPVRGTILAGKTITRTVMTGVQVVSEIAAEAGTASIDLIRNQLDLNIETAEFQFEIEQRIKELEQLMREEPLLRAEAFTLAEKVSQNAGQYQSILAKGLRLMEERVAFRKNAAAETQVSRYQDMTFRIFRNDAIQKYRAQYDLAAQYVFLAAVAYDYETQLLGGRPGAGRDFLTDIVKQRALGEVVNGVPVAGRHGLADPLARLNQNFGVLKGQLGFNNPQTETGQFSLRSGLFRIRENSTEAWEAELRKHIVTDLWQIPEFRRYCRPFAPESAGPQPGIVIRFPTTVTFGLNYFGWPLGGGDSAYDSTLFATKVRSAGVWFTDYNGSGLSLTPRVYLVPAGADIMRSPSGNNLETREWRVVDQKIPVPFPIGFSSLNDSTWIPMNDSLSDTFAGIRRFSSFRAYHDNGTFNPSETISDSRLIGRSVWNTDWMLIIPGGTFLFDSEEGLDTFINSVSDIKIFFQTYAYSGN